MNIVLLGPKISRRSNSFHLLVHSNRKVLWYSNELDSAICLYKTTIAYCGVKNSSVLLLYFVLCLKLELNYIPCVKLFCIFVALRITSFIHACKSRSWERKPVVRTEVYLKLPFIFTDWLTKVIHLKLTLFIIANVEKYFLLRSPK